MHLIAKTVEPGLYSDMRTLEQIEEEVRQLPATQQRVLLAKLAGFVADGTGSETTPRENLLARFFAEWDTSHSVGVGEKPTRERTYAGNPRLR
jgi:hypothetical protein